MRRGRPCGIKSFLEQSRSIFANDINGIAQLAISYTTDDINSAARVLAINQDICADGQEL